MQFVRVFGIDYYVLDGVMPAFAKFFVDLWTDRYGNDLDAIAPACVRLNCAQYLRRWGSLNV